MPDTQVRITATGLRAIARRFGALDKEVGKVGRTGNRVGNILTRQFSGLQGKVGGLRSMIAGLGVVMKGKDILGFGDTLGTIQAKAKLTNVEAQKLRDQLLALGPAYGIGKDEAVGAAQAFQDYTGVLREGMKDFDLLAKLHKGAATSMKDLAVIDALFIKQGFNYDERIKAFASLVAQADAGTVSLQAMARIAPEVLGLGQTYGFKGQRGVSQLGTAVQVAGGVFGGRAEESRTSVKALLRDLNANQKKIKGRLGVEVFSPGGGMRDLTELMSDITRATRGRMSGRKGLSQFFTADSQVLAGAWAQAIKGGDVSKIMAAGAGAGEKDIEAAFRARVEGVAKDFDKVQRGLGKLDQQLQKLGGTLLGFMLEDPAKTAAVAGGGYAAIKILPAIARFLMRKPGGGGGVGGAIGGLGVQAVFVVNMPGATPWQAAGFGLGPSGNAAGKAATVGGKALGVAQSAVKLLGAGAAGYALGTAANEMTGESDLFAEMWFQGMKKTGMLQGPGLGSKSGKTTGVFSMAQGLSRAASLGTSSFQTAGGGRQALTTENVMSALMQKGKESGLIGQELKQAVAAAIKENPIVIKVEAKGGLDAPNVRRGRPQ